MNRLKDTKYLVVAALLTSLTTIATMVIKVPTPTMGYVHIGDALVLLCGFLLGGVPGALAAGIGSGLADLLSGYAAWVPGTFVIKAATAGTAAGIYHLISKKAESSDAKKTESADNKGKRNQIPALLLSGILGEAVMVVGYFFYNIIMISFANGTWGGASLAAAAAESFAEIPFNIMQGVVGIILAVLLFPILHKIAKELNIVE